MRIYYTQLRRKGGASALLTILLALSVGFAALGFAAWRSVRAQLDGINGQYTTIAIPKEQRTGELYGYEMLEDGRIRWSDGSVYTPLWILEEAAQGAPQVIGQDRRCLLGAQVAGCRALSSGAVDVLQYNVAFDQYCYNLCVLAVRCESVEMVVPEVELDTPFPLGYEAYFTLVEPVARLDSYDLPPEDDTIVLINGFYTANAAVPFQPGHTYLLRGFYADYPIIQSVYDREDGSHAFVWERGDQGQKMSSSRTIQFVEGYFVKVGKNRGFALQGVTLRALWRRRGASALLAAVAAIGSFAAIVLHNLTARQEAAMEEMIRQTEIRCVVTDIQGIGSDNLNMVSSFVDMLTGLRHERGCYLDEYTKNVRALATEPLESPRDCTLRRILSLDSEILTCSIT